MLLQALSIGREADVWKPRMGVVHSVFERAVNLLVDGEMWTVLDASRPDAPFGVRLTNSADGFNVTVGDRVDVRSGFVGVGRLSVDCRTATRWAPTTWAGVGDGLEARLFAVEDAARPRAWSESASMAEDVVTALHGSERSLIAAVRRTVGRGPGLTPSGDDVLVGILALLTSGAVGAAGTRAASRLAHALAPVWPTTSDISQHLLSQAARGLPGRALHDLGWALIECAQPDIFSDAIALVLDTGATSGADACMGFAAACRSAFHNTELAAA
jgi:hypothetical protein